MNSAPRSEAREYWSWVEEQSVRRMLRAGNSIDEIANYLGRSPMAVATRLHSERLMSGEYWSLTEEEAVRRMMKAGRSVDQVARELGRSPAAVEQRMRTSPGFQTPGAYRIRAQLAALQGRLSGADIDALLDGVGERGKLVLSHRFGLGAVGPLTLEQIGRRFGVSRERIRQLEREALRKLCHPTRLPGFLAKSEVLYGTGDRRDSDSEMGPR